MSTELEKELLTLLSGIAMYNDKGRQWMNHDQKKIKEIHEGFSKSLKKLLAEFGKENLTRQALNVFNSPTVAGDDKGTYAATVKKLLASNNFYM